MKLRLLAALCALMASGGAALADITSIVVNPKAAERFITLPDFAKYPEGIAVNPKNGDIYVGTFDGSKNAPNFILRFSRKGGFINKISVGLNQPLLGLAFNVRNSKYPNGDDKLYFANFGQSKIQRVDAELSGQIEDVADIPYENAPDPEHPDEPLLSRLEGNPDGSQDKIVFGSNPNPEPEKGHARNRAPNALVFSKRGDLYISDSFQGRIYFRENPADPTSTPGVEDFALDGRWATAGFPPFGANGLAFNEDESALYIANTGDDRVFKLFVDTESRLPRFVCLDANGVPKGRFPEDVFCDSPGDTLAYNMSVFAQSVNGADGLAFDKRSGLLWVAANQADEVVGLNADGRVVARLGAFLGFDKKGGKVAARGLLFPASLAIVGDSIFVTNLALPLSGTPDEPETEISSYTISRIRIPDERDRDEDDRDGRDD